MRGYIALLGVSLILALYSGVTSAVIPIDGPCAGKRLAISADGNLHDADDVGAYPMSAALIGRRISDASVIFRHYHWGSHKWQENTGNNYAAMVASNNAVKNNAGLNNNLLKDAAGGNQPKNANINAAVNHLKNQINAAATLTKGMCIIIQGPIEIPYLALNAANSANVAKVDVYIHTNWNKNHGKNKHGGASWNQLKNTGVKSAQQILGSNGFNSTVWKNTKSAWNWLNTVDGGKWSWVRDRIQQSAKGGDISDAGLMFYVLTAETNPTMNRIENYFKP